MYWADQISNGAPHENWLHPKLTFLRQHVSGRLRPALLVLACSVGVVMLIVCANLSNLLLARTATRQKEMRSGPRWARDEAADSPIADREHRFDLLRSCAGTVLAVIAHAGHGASGRRLTFRCFNRVHVDSTALGFTLLIAVITGVVVGLLRHCKSHSFR